MKGDTVTVQSPEINIERASGSSSEIASGSFYATPDDTLENIKLNWILLQIIYIYYINWSRWLWLPPLFHYNALVSNTFTIPFISFFLRFYLLFKSRSSSRFYWIFSLRARRMYYYDHRVCIFILLVLYNIYIDPRTVCLNVECNRLFRSSWSTNGKLSRDCSDQSDSFWTICF